MCVCVCGLTAVLRQRWEFVDVFTRVLAARHAEAELKVETLQQLLSEVMSLDHPEVLYRHVSHCELDAGRTKDRKTERCGEITGRRTKTETQLTRFLVGKDSHKFSLTWLQPAAVGGKRG